MISIIIPTYNHASSLATTIESVLSQKDVDLEVIVVNDGSTDNTRALLEGYVNNPRVQVIHQENQGRNPARNRGFEASSGEYLLFLDADANIEPGALKKLQTALDTTDAAFAYGDFTYGFKRFTAGPFNATNLRKQNTIHTSALIRRRDFPGFDNEVKRFQDWDLWLTILEQGGEGVYIPEELMQFSTQERGISTWLPKAWYHAPWKWLPWIRPRVEAYEEAKRYIQSKHNLS